MKIHLRADEANGTHTKFTVFMNGADCGQLCMSEEEAALFEGIVIHSNFRIPGEDEYYSSGHWTKEVEK